jgi:hypothetical protein
MKRFLTQREADRCENAKEPACKCRCGGALHGAKRVPSGGDFSVLPLADPHYRPTLTKAQTLKLLRSVATRVTLMAADYFSRDWDMAWRDALEILGKAIKDVKGETHARNT